MLFIPLRYHAGCSHGSVAMSCMQKQPQSGGQREEGKINEDYSPMLVRLIYWIYPGSDYCCCITEDTI